MLLETWRPISFGKVYEISSYGQVRNTKTGKTLSGWINEDGYRRVTLSDENGKKKTPYVHLLVAEAFIGPRPPDQQVRHWDGNPLNNRLDNLLYGTPSENVLDTVRYGNHTQARKTHCPQGHEYSEENTYIFPNGARHCKTCRAESQQKFEAQYVRVRVNGKRVRVKRSEFPR